MYKKKLVIGLGDIGSQIVEKVSYQFLDNDNIAFLCIDSDVNSLKNRKNIFTICLDNSKTMKELLRDNPNWKDWLPNDPLFINSNLSVNIPLRSLSRLAFENLHNYFEIDHEISKVLDSLFKVDGIISPLEVYIVSTLAGSTGSALLIELPFLIEKNLLNLTDVFFNGIFITPDLIIREIYDVKVKEDTYVNTYATLKEINAINYIKMLPIGTSSPFRLNFNGFSSEEDVGMFNRFYKNIILIEEVPWHNGGPIKNINEWIDKVTLILKDQLVHPYPLFFDPFLIKSENIYGSSNAIKLVYPYEDILDYIATRKANEIIKVEYTDIEEVQYDYKHQYEKSFTLEKYIINFFELKNYETGFFYLTEDLLKDLNNRINLYFENLKKFLLDQFNVDKELQYYKKLTIISENDIKELKKVNKAIEIFSSLEKITEEYENYLDRYIKVVEIKILSDIFINNSVEDLNIYNLFMNNSYYVRPFLALYILAQLIDYIEQDLKVYKQNLEKLDQKMKHFEKAFDDPSTEIVEDPYIALENFSSKLFSRYRKSYKDFIDKYVRLFTEHIKDIEKLYENKLLYKVFYKILERLKKYFNKYLNISNELTVLESELYSDYINLEKKNRSNTVNKYMRASDINKRELFNKIDQNYSISEGTDSEISKIIFKKVVQSENCSANSLELKEIKEKKEKRFEDYNDKIVSLIKEDIKNQFDSILDKNIGEILIEEKYNIKEIYNTIYPLLNYSLKKRFENRKVPEEIIIRLHPETARSIEEKTGTKVYNYFESKFKDYNYKYFQFNVIESDSYSPYEIIYSHTVSGIAIGEIELINYYYDYYRKRLKEKNYISPHLDYHWDTELPNIFDLPWNRKDEF